MSDAPAVVAADASLTARQPPPASISRTHGDVLFHIVLLFISAGVLLAAFGLRTDGAAVFLPILNQPLPEACTLRRLTGLPCPGCGLTRCFISLAHGDVAAAWSFNPAGILLFVLVAFQLPLRGYQLWRIQHGRSELSLTYFAGVSFVVFFVALIGQWLLRLLGIAF